MNGPRCVRLRVCANECGGGVGLEGWSMPSPSGLSVLSLSGLCEGGLDEVEHASM